MRQTAVDLRYCGHLIDELVANIENKKIAYLQVHNEINRIRRELNYIHDRFLSFETRHRLIRNKIKGEK